MTTYNLLTIIIDTPLLAFFFYSLIRLLSFKINKKKAPLFTDIVDFAAIGLALISSIVTFLWTLLPFFGDNTHVTLDRALGRCWLGFWWYPLILMITQLLWLKKFRSNEAFRFIMSILLVIQPNLIEKIVILTMQRDYKT